MPKHFINGGAFQHKRRVRDNSERAYDEDVPREKLFAEYRSSRSTPPPYKPQFEIDVLTESNNGKIIEVTDTKTDQIWYIVHKWTRPDRKAFRVVGKAISLGDARWALDWWASEGIRTPDHAVNSRALYR